MPAKKKKPVAKAKPATKAKAKAKPKAKPKAKAKAKRKPTAKPQLASTPFPILSDLVHHIASDSQLFGVERSLDTLMIALPYENSDTIDGVQKEAAKATPDDVIALAATHELALDQAVAQRFLTGITTLVRYESISE